MTKHLRLLLFIMFLTIGRQDNTAIEDLVEGGECGFGGE